MDDFPTAPEPNTTCGAKKHVMGEMQVKGENRQSRDKKRKGWKS